MIEETQGSIEYRVYGKGPTVVLVPGSCSTGNAWRPVINAWDGHFRCTTTSLLGYGQTAERRTASDFAIAHEVDVLSSVVRRAGHQVHLVGHSFGALVALAFALRSPASLASLTLIEAPAVDLLRQAGEVEHFQAFRQMTNAYLSEFLSGNPEAIGLMIDFYGGRGTFASWPSRVRDFCIATTTINLLDWSGVYGFQLAPHTLKFLQVPTLVISGGKSHPAMQRASALLGEHIRYAEHVTLADAAHFMIATHPDEIAQLIASHVNRAEVGVRWPA